MNNLAEKIVEASKTSFVDFTIESEETLRPKLLYNDVKRGSTVLAYLEKELKNCKSFWFSVAFITKSGLIVLKDILRELEMKNPQVKGRILTTDYLGFNDPDALRDLMKFSNFEVRVFTQEYFHTKGYMFNDGDKNTFIVGSSNLTQNALKSNKEWNLKITSLEEGELIKESNDEFEEMWTRATKLTEYWIATVYEPFYKNQRKTRTANISTRLTTYTLQPNIMQKEATMSLAALREDGARKAILISATGERDIFMTGERNLGFIRVSGAWS